MMKKFVVLLLVCLLSISAIALDKQPLPENQAFAVSSQLFGNDTLLVSWKIAPKHYLYQARFQFKVLKPSNAQVGTIIYPPSQLKNDGILGDYQVYTDQVTLPVPIINSDPTDTLVQITYQGCSEDGYCYPPTTRTFQINFATREIHSDNSLDIAALPQPSIPNHFSALLDHHHLFTIFLAFIGFGLLLSFTPCVLPMIPILSGIIVGHGHKITTGKAFRLSAIYVLSMSITYAIAGILVGYVGSSIQSLFQNTWVLVAFSILFVLLALSFFGFYQIKLPTRFEERIANISRHQKSGHYLGVASMGCLATLILSPCVTPALIGVLGYIAQSGDAALGGFALFALGLGMGLPLIVIGTVGGKLLPKAGHWMQTVESIFGVLFLAIAIFMLERIIPGPISMLLWSGLLIISAIYMGAISATPASGWGKLWKGLGFMMLAYGVLLLIGVALGNSNPLKPLAGLPIGTVSNNNSNSRNNSLFTRANSLEQVQTQLALAKAKGKPVILDFYADWCIACKEMEYTTFADPQVQALMQHFIRLQADVTANNATDKNLMQYYGVVAPPTLLFFDRYGKPLKDISVIGFMDSADLNSRLQHIISLNINQKNNF